MLQHLELSSTKQLMMSGPIVHAKSNLNISDVTHLAIQHHRGHKIHKKTKEIKMKVVKNGESFVLGEFFPLRDNV